MARGEPIKIWGWAPFDLQLGPVSLWRVLMVAGIEDEILLRDDILRRDPEGPMDILNTEKVMCSRDSGYQSIWLVSRSEKLRYWL